MKNVKLTEDDYPLIVSTRKQFPLNKQITKVLMVMASLEKTFPPTFFHYNIYHYGKPLYDLVPEEEHGWWRLKTIQQQYYWLHEVSFITQKKIRESLDELVKKGYVKEKNGLYKVEKEGKRKIEKTWTVL